MTKSLVSFFDVLIGTPVAPERRIRFRYVYRSTEDDGDALAGDWRAIGQDIRKSMDRLEYSK